jgi:hypothetical protein
MPKTTDIKQPSKLREVLGIFSALDAARWSNTGNYNLINYCGEGGESVAGSGNVRSRGLSYFPRTATGLTGKTSVCRR